MMHFLIVSASAWRQHQLACTSIANRLLVSSVAAAQTLVIDFETAKREEVQTPEAKTTRPPSSPLSMRAWIDHYFRDQPMLDVERVHRAAESICYAGAGIAAIDASALSTDLIDRTLNQLRVAFYGCDHWPQVLILIVDDAILHDVAGFAGRVFFIQPDVSGQARINTLLGHIYRFAKLEGLFGLRHKFLTQLVKVVSRSRKFAPSTEEK